MKTALIVFPGSNCDRDMAVALEKTTGFRPQMVWHKEQEIPESDLILIPGGFTFGDYLRCGALAAKSPVVRAVIEQANRGVRVLGVCNGFQILAESGLLPGALLRNSGMKFVCRNVWLRCENSQSDFTVSVSGGKPLLMPVAHQDGNYFNSEDELKRLNDQEQVAFRYVSGNNEICPEANPNGSLENIAGVFNRTRNVMGLMPHPERAVDVSFPVDFPTCADTVGHRGDGRLIFSSLLESLA